MIFTFTARGNRVLDLRSAGRFIGNPIIIATVLGLFFSAAALSVPEFIGRSFDIVADMALPLALFIIGGSLKPAPARRLQLVGFSTLMKLFLLPLAGLMTFRFLGLAPVPTEAAVILLASPSATVTYIMASEMGGKPDLAAAAVTVSTVFSIVTYTLWIAVLGG